MYLVWGQNTFQELSHAREVLRACDKAPRKEDKGLVTLVSSNTELFLECARMLLPGIAD